MKSGNASLHTGLELGQLLPTSARLTTGSFVVITEGVAATIGFLVPRNHWVYIAGLLLAITFLGAAERFRRFSKVGADISDLLCWEVVAWTVALACYLAGTQPAFALYCTATLSILKLWRLYMWQGTLTYEQGWGIFGPMSYLHAKKTGTTASHRQPAMYRALILAICCAAAGSIGYKHAPDPLRLAIAWLLPLTFELIFGPRQLASLAQFVPAFLASNQREAALIAKNAALEKALAAAQQAQGMPPDPNLAALIASYNSTTPERREHLTFFAQVVAEQFPAEQPETDA
jgi:hypothetical protein